MRLQPLIYLAAVFLQLGIAAPTLNRNEVRGYDDWYESDEDSVTKNAKRATTRGYNDWYEKEIEE